MTGEEQGLGFFLAKAKTGFFLLFLFNPAQPWSLPAPARGILILLSRLIETEH